MSTAIVFATEHGTTKKVASMIYDRLEDPNTDLFNLKIDINPNISSFDTVIVGGSIHDGKIQKQVINFLETNKEFILSKVLGLFICGMYEDIAEKEFNNVYPEIFRRHAIAHGQLGGEYKFEKKNYLERKITAKTNKSMNSISHIEQQAINIFVNDIITMR